MTEKILTLACPTCKKQVTWSEEFPQRPFCCERCRLVDLGEWASEGYKVAGEPVTNDDFSDDENKY